MKRITFFSTSARRCLAAAVLLFVALLPVVGNTNTYYYRADVSVNSTGGGKVYISRESTNIYDDTADKFVSGYATTINNNSITANMFYLYAVPNTDWEFDYWGQSNRENGTYTKINGAPATGYNPEITFSGSSERNATRFYYRAFFKEQTGVVTVNVAETGRGTATITSGEESNKVGGYATLSASPDASNGIHFLGWNKSQTDTENFISENNPYTINPITDDNKGTYYAHFSPAQESIYCRIQNRATKRFLILCGKKKAGKHEKIISGRTGYDGFVFDKSLHLISEDDAKGNPMTVFLRNGFSGGVGITNRANLVANEIEYHNLVTENATSNEYQLTMVKDGNNGVRIFTSYTYTPSSGDPLTFDTYLTDDEDYDYAVMQSDASMNIYWDVYLLEKGNTEGSFGANTKADFFGNGKYGANGKYYTTMFTYFPYQLTEGVKAYYLPITGNIEDTYNQEKSEVYFTEISGTVPMESAVVLECDDVYSGSNNILIPLMASQNPGKLPGTNLLNGYISLYNQDGSGPNLEPNDKKYMFILSKIGEDLGWFYYTKDNMTPNKAFLDLREYAQTLDEHEHEARSLKFSFGKNDDDNEATGIIAPKYAEKVDGALFDLNGRRVTDGDAYGLKKGIYISNGKKIVVK